MQAILDQARWAPSADNTQPWRFEVHDEHHVTVHGHSEKDLGIYDLLGRGGQLAAGALLQTIQIAATGHGLSMQADRIADSPAHCPSYDVRFTPDGSVTPSELIPCIEARRTQRRPLKTTPLSNDVKAQLEAAAGDAYRIHWVEGSQRSALAKLLYRSAHIRLTSEEAYKVHTQIIEWNATFSDDRIPDKAIGLDPFTVRFMKWAMKSWKRVDFLNRYFAGSVAPRVQLDLMPGKKCAAHLVLIRKDKPDELDDRVDAGRALQRVWLTAEKLGLQMQPEMTPVIFSEYVRRDIAFSPVAHHIETAKRVAERFAEMLGGQDVLDHAVCMGRVGYGKQATSRSLRLDMDRLAYTGSGENTATPQKEPDREAA